MAKARYKAPKDWENNIEKLNILYVKRSVEKTDKYDKEIDDLKEKINTFEFGSINNTLTNKKSYSYKDLIHLKNIKYK